ncbi:MAG: YbaN family protein [Thermoanaerobaculaceae bacterium]|nr:YbaN family protein [Thermoanaerobaculaceae bacterium]
MDQPELQRAGLWAKPLWNLAGTACLAVGALGLVLPVLPTTPFLLLAAGCYLRGSARMHRWMMTNRLFGARLAAYRAGQGVPARTKVAAIASLWLGIGISAGLLVETPAIRIMLLAIGAAVTVHLVMLPAMRSTSG